MKCSVTCFLQLKFSLNNIITSIYKCGRKISNKTYFIWYLQFSVVTYLKSIAFEFYSCLFFPYSVCVCVCVCVHIYILQFSILNILCPFMGTHYFKILTIIYRIHKERMLESSLNRKKTHEKNTSEHILGKWRVSAWMP